MLARASGTVETIEAEREGAQEITVRAGGNLRPAIVYPQLTGRAAVGDSVLLNTWAVEMGLGTGGFDFVICINDGETHEVPPGHILKLRYTPMQIPVLAAAAPESPYHSALEDFTSLDTTPVVCAELHSQVPAIAAAVKWETHGKAKVVYVMTDGAALPMGFSRLVPQMKASGLIDATITAGQAFGGDLEAVNIYSGLATAYAVLKADVIIVSQGPGNTGTETSLGFSGIDQGIALNAVAALDGTAIAVMRLSFADPRARHNGLSHHTRTVLERIVLRPVLAPIPRLEEAEQYYLRHSLEESELKDRHEFITIEAEPGYQALLDCGVTVTTMGRSVREEKAFFLAAAAAGLLAGQWASDRIQG